MEALQRKIDIEKANGEPIGDLNDFAFLKPVKAATTEKRQLRLVPKPDWYQNNSHVFITFRIENGDDSTAKSVDVLFEKQVVIVKLADDDEPALHLKLAAEIETAESEFKASGNRVEIKV